MPDQLKPHLQMGKIQHTKNCFSRVVPVVHFQPPKCVPRVHCRPRFSAARLPTAPSLPSTVAITSKLVSSTFSAFNRTRLPCRRHRPGDRRARSRGWINPAQTKQVYYPFNIFTSLYSISLFVALNSGRQLNSGVLIFSQCCIVL